jgi:hypothetical protein
VGAAALLDEVEQFRLDQLQARRIRALPYLCLYNGLGAAQWLRDSSLRKQK